MGAFIMPFLEISSGSKEPTVYHLRSGRVTIGRSRQNDVVIEDDTASSHHAVISLINRAYFIEDTESANGTYVNGIQVRRKRLRDRDRISIGRTYLRYFVNPKPDRQEEVPVKRADSKKILRAFAADTPSPKSLVALRQAHENLKRIYEINAIISSIFDVRELAEKILEIIFSLFKADRGYIMLLETGQSELNLVASKKKNGAGAETGVDFSRTIAQRVLETEESVITCNAPEDERFPDRQSILGGHIKSAMCVPIRGRNDKLGIIYVDHRGAPDHFSEEHLQLLTMVANSAGIAIDNIRLYEENLKIQVLKAINEEMQEKNRKLMELESLKEDLINMVVHDMKNPVTNTMMALDLVALDPQAQLSEQQREYIQLAKRNQFKLSEMIANLLELSKLESGRMQIERAPLDLANLLDRVVERYAAVLNKEDQSVIADIKPAAREIVSDERLLERVLSNILSNAMKHSPPRAEIHVAAAPAADTGEIVVSVRDFGDGIPSEFHQKIFEKFCQAGLRELGHRTDTGLGLAFCKMAIEAMGGRIWVDSKPKKGSCFSFSLPRQPVAETASDQTSN